MESWRIELYNSLSHSVEGSTWKDHKYVAIVNGKYIYPEDLKKEKGIYATTGTINGSNSSAVKTSSAASSSSKGSGNTSEQSTAVNPASISYTDKGSVKSYRYLPKDPAIGDMYLLEDTKQKVYWNGEIWTPYVEQKKVVQNGGSSSYSGAGKKEELSAETTKRVRGVIGTFVQQEKKTVKLNPSASGSSKKSGGGGR